MQNVFSQILTFITMSATKPGSNAGASGAGAAGKGALSEVAKLQVTRENIEKEKRFFHLIETFSANPKTGMFIVNIHRQLHC